MSAVAWRYALTNALMVAFVSALAHGGWIVAGSGVRTDVTVPAVGELVKEVARMGEAPVTEQEMIAHCRSHLTD